MLMHRGPHSEKFSAAGIKSLVEHEIHHNISYNKAFKAILVAFQLMTIHIQKPGLNVPLQRKASLQ